MNAPRLSVVIATYAWPEALSVVLRALSEQSDPAFEVVVADDGSAPGTAAVVEGWRAAFGGRLLDVWQADEGYRRARVLNLGARAASGDALVFLDGDCVPRRRFVESVRRALHLGWFLAGKRLNLNVDLSRRVIEEHFPVWRWSAAEWLLRAPHVVRRPGLLLPLRDRRRPWRARQPEFVPPFGGYGSPLGVSRVDFDSVNGFDSRFVGWGQEDEEIALRLRRAGLRCGWPGPRSTLIHLWHETRVDRMRPNTALLRETQRSDRIEAVDGLGQIALALEEHRSRVGSSS